ncbi:MAG: CBS domain-containing protein [Actinomycetota bacterium]|nr:CBS domain-containing protein [Actinomycetota bacterium]
MQEAYSACSGKKGIAREPLKKDTGKRELLVRDVMHLGVLTCKVDTPLCEVAQMMTDNRVHCVVVVDEAGEACGVISDLGILQAYGRDIANMRAEDVLKGCTIAVQPTAPIQEAVAEMIAKHVHHLVILGEHPLHRPVGVLAASDIVREIAKGCRR